MVSTSYPSTNNVEAGNVPPATRNHESFANEAYSFWARLFKKLLAFLMMVAVLGCNVYSTLFTFTVAKDLTIETAIINDDVAVRSKGDADFVALWLILFLPSAFGFTRAVIKEALSSGQPSPTWLSMLLIAAVSVAEVAGLWLFTFHVLTDDKVDVPTAIVLMSAVLIGHIIPQRFKRKQWWLISHVLGVVCIGVGVAAQVQWQNIPSDSPLVWAIPLSLVPLSIAWSPYIQLFQMEIKLNASPTNVASGSNERPGRNIQDNHGTDNGIQAAHVRATIAKNFCNMVILVIALFVVPSYIDHRLDGISVPNGFTSLYLRHTETLFSVLPAFGGYVLGVIACSMSIQLWSFLVPLSLSPMATLIFAVSMDLCPWFGNDLWCRKGAQAVIEDREYFSVGLVVLGQILCSIYNYATTVSGIHEKESNMFWYPQHAGVLTGQHMMLNRTKVHENSNISQSDHEGTDLRGCVMICTTMYRETWDEMSKYLESIKRVAASEKLGNKYSWAGKFEAHVYFDNGLRGDKLTDFSAQLACLVRKKFQAVDCTVKMTWYGWKLHWDLPGSLGLPLNIHLKDNQKVKAKKRRSQVMYMDSAVNSMISCMDTNKRVKYILATDGDVDFGAGSIVAMLLQMLSDREEKVGAVCARTHPVGSGPFVWYQMFDYAIGHWLQKVANHVLGSVLCAPGCFSIYRVEAIADVLEEYRSDVEEASDFLTKDMGEDRWFSTLLVKAGWKINYCAGAFDSTHCPEEFDEFWKQRRRWIPSTLANQILLLKNWKIVSKKNKHISMVFLFFQVVLLLSSVISPSTCILILTGGLYYGVGVPTWLSFALFILLTLVFAVICIRYSQDTQLKFAKILCFFFMLAMAVAAVGTVSQMVLANTSHNPSIESVHGDYEGCYLAYVNSDNPLLPHAVTPMTDLTNGKCMDHCYHNHFEYSGTGHPAICFCGSEDDMKNGTKLEEDMCAFSCPGNSGEFCGGKAKPGQISVYNIQELLWIKLPADVSTLYIAILVGIYIMAALLHPGESMCIIYSVVYLLTLPCVYILQNVYSVCNLTDRSWGTREARSHQDQDKDKLSYDIMAKLRQFWTFGKQCCQRSGENSDEGAENDTLAAEGLPQSNRDADNTRAVGFEGRECSNTADDSTGPDRPLPSLNSTRTRDWLKRIFGQVSDKVETYERKFTREGYTDTSFIAGMTDKDLKDIGVLNPQDRHYFRRRLKKLQQDEPDIDITVPDNVENWLAMIGLQEYKENFNRAFPGVAAREVFQELKVMTEDGIKGRLGITAKGHLRRLKLAITRIRQPTLREGKILEAKRDIEKKFQEHQPDVENSQTDATGIEETRPDDLDPTTEQFRLDQNKEDEFKENLVQLRNYYLLVFLVANSVWLVLMFTLVQHAHLQVLNTNPLGLAFLVTFSLVLVVQFAALVFHRLATFIQWVSRIPMFDCAPTCLDCPCRRNNNNPYNSMV